MRQLTPKFFVGIALLALAAVLIAQPLEAKVRAGVVNDFELVSPSPYPSAVAGQAFVWETEAFIPGATWIKLRFSEFDLAPGDRLEISDASGATRHSYTGRGPKDSGSFWALSVPGDRAEIRLYSHGAGGRGFVVDQVARGEQVRVEESVCGSDGREDIACYGQAGKNITEPVARLTYCDGFFCFNCTGFLVDGSSTNMLMTNEHCLTNQAAVDTLEADFNFQNASCGGGANDPTSTYSGDAFISDDPGLDYALVTLSGNAAANHGEFPITDDPISNGDLIAIPQHGGGNEKTLGFWEDSAQTSRCDAHATNVTVVGYDAGSQLTYGCDTEGGSSGSPVAGLAQRAAVGIHHLGGCDNVATHMDEICADAGSLLNCL